MTDRPPRLQGTDGIRARVDLSRSFGPNDGSPLDDFLQTGLLTPVFVELYCFSFIEFLRQTYPQPPDTIVVGWDPRDPDAVLAKAAIRAVRKAGVHVKQIGVVPTPLVPMTQIALNADGGIMLTASHNPPDQNGVKLFAGRFGLKLFPHDDEKLTRILYQQDWHTLSDLPETGQVQHMETLAQDLFRAFHLDPRNHWIAQTEKLAGQIVLVDHANGSLRGFAVEILQKMGFRDVIDVYEGITRPVNQHCGAAELEGQSVLSRDMLDAQPALMENRVVTELLRVGQEHRHHIRAGKMHLTAVIFDGDGDRFLRADYDPHLDAIRLISGDEIVLHMARFMQSRQNPAKPIPFVFTVESDLQTGNAAANLGMNPIMTGVGDKWLLLQATLTLLRQSAPLTSPFTEHIQQLETHPSHEVLAKIQTDLGEFAPQPLHFVGSEESGHTVTPGFLHTPDDQERVIFAGNGLKSALNLFAATSVLDASSDHSNFWEQLQHPFEPGFKKTFYVFYTQKSKLQAGTPFWQKLSAHVHETTAQHFPEAEIQLAVRSEEPNMLLFEVRYPNESGLRAAVFLRNSGTEDKSGVYLRGQVADQAQLLAIGTTIRQFLLAHMLNTDHPYLQAGLKLMKSGHIETDAISQPRLLSELHKGELIDSDQKPTALGEWLLNQLS